MDAQLVQNLKALGVGTVAVAGEDLYKKASALALHTIKPSAVVRPESAGDVAKLLRFIHAHKLPFAIRSGGHSSIAERLADGILLIDLSGIASVEIIDGVKGLVRIGAGAIWYDVATELDKHGLGISSGDTRSVGVGGLSTGGGLGWMIRKYGPVVDNILTAEVVVADGTIIEADERHHSDLFWAIRGGGSNFGIVTHFTFKAHPVKGIFDGTIMLPVENVASVIKGWRDAMRRAPAELTTVLTTLPSFAAGRPAAIMIRGCFEGTDKVAADQAFAPFLTLGKPTHQTIAAKAYKEMLEEVHPPANVRVIGHNTFAKELTDELAEVIAAQCKDPVPLFQIRHLSGAMSEKPTDATAFSHRDSEVLIVHPTFITPEMTDNEIQATESSWRAIRALGEGVYPSLLSEDNGDEVERAYPPASLARLQKIKATYDPDNIFTANYNIKPKES
jgi:FAD/FMN-containing dehydrogenase